MRRKRNAKKRGGRNFQISLNEELVLSNQSEIDILAIHDALQKLEQIDAERSRIVELRFYGGLTIEEVAVEVGRTPDAVRGISHRARKKLREAMVRLSRYV